MKESPASKLMVYLSPEFDNDAVAGDYQFEVEKMDCANKK